ncbi:unnamed protein product [Oppiella nova]|uniref:Uncharacterized protein n=1 Tax=Oppiella nova TaxID=334625 RepID=A0A7R9R187_9ACAR|nr:unnamed protein product [Oppiella nova]CAG2182278.1 unnamed protein product [Oppiella nova]
MLFIRHFCKIIQHLYFNVKNLRK